MNPKGHTAYNAAVSRFKSRNEHIRDRRRSCAMKRGLSLKSVRNWRLDNPLCTEIGFKTMLSAALRSQTEMSFSMRRETTAERAAWTAHFDGAITAASKFGNTPQRFNGRRFDSKYEADQAAKLNALERAGIIRELRYQVPLVLVEGKGNIRSIKYVADFTYVDEAGKLHWLDAKGCKTPMYKLKRKLAALLHGIEIEEI